MVKRYLHQDIAHDLNHLRQMIFLVGPRQVGKTTLAKHLIKGGYWNWDVAQDRRYILSHFFKTSRQGIQPPAQMVLDEIHKYPRWKNALKGLFDLYEPETHWIITGSARLDVYKRGQDSLMGRVFTYRLAPLTLAELVQEGKTPPNKPVLPNPKHPPRRTPRQERIMERLYTYGGFPEPYIKKSKTFLSRWQVSRLDRMIHQDLASLEHLKHLPIVEELVMLLRPKASQRLSINSLREDLEVHFNTVKRWLDLLERVFYGWRIYPYTGRLSRSLKKEAKWYLWDWSECETKGARFENMVAVHLLKWVNYFNDTGKATLAIHYIRNKEKKEVDFVILKDKVPMLFLECKTSDRAPDANILFYQSKFPNARHIQLVYEGVDDPIVLKSGIEIWPADRFLSALI